MTTLNLTTAGLRLEIAPTERGIFFYLLVPSGAIVSGGYEIDDRSISADANTLFIGKAYFPLMDGQAAHALDWIESICPRLVFREVF